MAPKRVFVIWTNPLFHESARLLLNHPDVILIGADSDFTTAREAIMQLQPDTILFEKTKSGIPADMIEILDIGKWEVRLIGLSMENNEMSLYRREHQTVVRAGDLLQFVLG